MKLSTPQGKWAVSTYFPPHPSTYSDLCFFHPSHQLFRRVRSPHFALLYLKQHFNIHADSFVFVQLVSRPLGPMVQVDTDSDGGGYNGTDLRGVDTESDDCNADGGVD
jgi:hypothetical protein